MKKNHHRSRRNRPDHRIHHVQGRRRIQQDHRRGRDGQGAGAQVENTYQRRYDLVPNLVATVQGEADFEKSTLSAVVDARSKMGGVVKIDADKLGDEATMKRFQESQATLGGALQRLMMVTENYPDLKSKPVLPGSARTARRRGEPHRRGTPPLQTKRSATTTLTSASSGEHHRASRAQALFRSNPSPARTAPRSSSIQSKNGLKEKGRAQAALLYSVASRRQQPGTLYRQRHHKR